MPPDANQPAAADAARGMASQPGLTSIAVLGSCVTRDVFNRRFNPGYCERYRVTATGFRMSLPSVMSPSPGIDPALLDGPVHAEQRRRLELEVSRSITSHLAAEPPDLLLVDLCTDARLGVITLGDGSYLTANLGVLRKTRWWKNLDRQRLPRAIKPIRDPAPYLDVWDDAVRRLQGFLADMAPRTRVVLVKVRPTSHLWLPGVEAPVQLAAQRRMPPGDPDRYAAVLADLQERAAATTDWATIDMTRREYPTSDTHPWTAGPGHYAPDYYEDLLAALDALVGPDSQPPHGATGREVETGLGRRWDDEPGRGKPQPRPPTPARRGRHAHRTARGLAHRVVRRIRRRVG